MQQFGSDASNSGRAASIAKSTRMTRNGAWLRNFVAVQYGHLRHKLTQTVEAIRPVGGILPVHRRVGIDGHATRAKLDHRRVLPYVHRAGRNEAFDIFGQLALAGETSAIMRRRVH